MHPAQARRLGRRRILIGSVVALGILLLLLFAHLIGLI
jgi:hypothetical protein